MIEIESVNRDRLVARQVFDRAYRTVSNAQPYDFGRMPIQQTARLKVRILRHNHKAVSFRVFPDYRIRRVPHSQVSMWSLSG